MRVIGGIPAFQWRSLCLSVHGPVMKATLAQSSLACCFVCVVVRVKHNISQARGHTRPETCPAVKEERHNISRFYWHNTHVVLCCTGFSFSDVVYTVS